MSDGDYILIVDDDPDVRRLLLDTMTMLGLEADKAVNGQQALEIIAQKKPIAIILDLMMPVMDGFSTVAHLQGDKNNRNIPIILLSAMADADRQIARLPGVVGVMSKGNFSVEGLHSLLLLAGVNA